MVRPPSPQDENKSFQLDTSKPCGKTVIDVKACKAYPPLSYPQYGGSMKWRKCYPVDNFSEEENEAGKAF